MRRRALFNRLLHWSFTAALVASCLCGARFMQDASGRLDSHTRERQQALESLRSTQTQLAERRGRYRQDSATLQGNIQTILSSPAMEILFPGFHLLARDTHAGIFLQLLPIDSQDG